MNWESSIETYTVPYVKQIVVGSGCITQEVQPGALWQPREVRWGGGGRYVQEWGVICILMADSHCCMAETNPIL